MTREKFERFVKKYERLVFTICYQMVRDYHEAENLTQETFLSAYTHIDYCKSDNYKAWLARIAANKAKDYLKSAYMRRVTLGGEDFSFLESATERPDALLLDKEESAAIKNRIYALKEPYLLVSKLFFIEEKSPDEIARLLDRPPKTVRTQIYRAKKLLQEMLHNDEEG